MDLAKQLLWKTYTVGEVTDISQHELIYTISKGNYALISGGNNNEALRTELEELNYRITPATGNYGGRLEKMFLVHDPEDEEIIGLGVKYLQNSIILGKAGKHRMLFTNGPKKGKSKIGKGWEEPRDSGQHFTEVQTTDGKKFRFSLNF